MLRNNFKYAFYLIVALTVFSVSAGSYDDYFFALKNDQAEVVGRLLALGFDPNTRDAQGEPGLQVAVRAQSAQAVRALLTRHDLDVNALNEAGESALMLAALQGAMATTQWLLDSGAQVNQPGWSALHYAAASPQSRLVELLLQRGAAIDALSPNGTTPLMMAAKYGSEQSVAVLLAHGADVRPRNQRALDAADFARLAGRDTLAARLAAVSADRAR